MDHFTQTISDKLIHLLDKSVISFDPVSEESYQILSDLIGDARVVLMGECTHTRLNSTRYVWH